MVGNTGEASGGSRAERRQATYDELIARARDAVREGRTLSLRALAAEMGLTAPALYRYVDSHAALQEAVAEAIYADVLALLSAKADLVGGGSPGRRLLVAVVAFRRWALSSPAEFRLVYDTTPPWGDAPGEGTPPARRLFGRFLGYIEQLHRLGHIRPDAGSALPAAGVADMADVREQWGAAGDFPEASPELWWIALRVWAMLLGSLRMEVDGLVPAQVIADGTFFCDILAFVGQAVGGPADGMREGILAALAAVDGS